MQLDNITSIIAGFAIVGTVFGVIVRGWTSIKAFFMTCRGYILHEIKLEDEATRKAVLSYLVNKYKFSFSAERTYGSKQENLRNGKYGHIPYEELGTKNITFWRGFVPFWFVVKAPPAATEKSAVIHWGNKPKDLPVCSVTFVRGTINPDKLVGEACEIRNEQYWNTTGKKYCRRFMVRNIPNPNQPAGTQLNSSTLEWYNEGIYRLLKYKNTEIGKISFKEGDTVTNKLYFPDHVKKLIEEVKIWHNLKDWYMARNIPWKRGWCLYGPPGTGKTALVRAIAEDLDMPLFVYALGNMEDKELQKAWEEMQTHAPCIALFEDFDTVFHGRENVYGRQSLENIIQSNSVGKEKIESTVTGRLSFGCLLNCIDGVEKQNGIFTIFTTNHIDTLDPALGQPRVNEDGTIELISTRPGRIDKAIELGYMRNKDKLKLAKRIFFDDLDGYRQIKQYIKNNLSKKETPAQFQERCSQLALESLWKKQNENKI